MRVINYLSFFFDGGIEINGRLAVSFLVVSEYDLDRSILWKHVEIIQIYEILHYC